MTDDSIQGKRIGDLQVRILGEKAGDNRERLDVELAKLGGLHLVQQVFEKKRERLLSRCHITQHDVAIDAIASVELVSDDDAADVFESVPGA